MNTSSHSIPAAVAKERPALHRRRSSAGQIALLSCGILSSFYYVAMNIIVPAYFPGYNIASQTVSELSAIGAPSRELWVALAAIYSTLVILFGLGIWMSAGANRKIRVVASLMLVFGISGFFWPPMHLRETIAAGGGTLTDTLHIWFAVFTSVLMISMIGFASAALGKPFRIYSIISILLMLVFGALTGLESPAIAENLPTPLIGVWERINIGVFMVWLIALGVVLIKKSNGQSYKQVLL